MRGLKYPILVAAVLAACHRPSEPPAPVMVFPTEWPHAPSVEPTSGKNGIVVSDAAMASQVGAEILRRGGNAVDAAVATGFALAVVYPEAGNLGGGGFTVVRMADGREAALDYRETAPAAASRDMFANDTTNPRKSVVGPLASGVPGSVAGLTALQLKFGSMPLRLVMAPAIRLAEDGFFADSQLAASLKKHQALIARFAGAAVFLPKGKALVEGVLVRQPALARTLRAISDSGASAFYTGSVSRELASDLAATGSLITAADLAAYKPEWREPIRGTYRGHVLLTMPPPSSGATMIEILNIIEGFDPLPAFGTAKRVHLLVSAMQRAFTDRNALIGDPAFVKVPVDHLLDKSYAAKLRAGIGAVATPSKSLAQPSSAGSNTTPYAVIDKDGNAVATTTTINDLYGSGVYLPNAGFFMNDEMDDFAARPGQANLYDLVQGEQNAVAPSKRMLSSMLPTIVLDRAGRAMMAVAGRGGPRIVSGVTQTIVNVIDHRMTIADAISAPRVHHQALPDTIRFERDGLNPGVIQELRQMGYAVEPWGTGAAVSPDGNLGSVNGILRVGNRFTGFSDPRAGGKPAVP
ncbi:MAG TPA: gamma-glutamyltransferase, partial [Gemmatimonadaceae bacterium]